MAFVKRNWLARIGTGLNKFIIGAVDGDGKQTLVNSPDSITQQGDVISADNLNDLEDRIEGEFTSLDTAKQDVLTFDNTPTQDSNNPVKSGGVYSMIADTYTKTLLWENPDTEAEFGAETVTLSDNYTNYDELLIFFYLYNTDHTVVVSHTIHLIGGLQATYKMVVFTNCSGASYMTRARQIYIDGTHGNEVHFLHSYYWAVKNGGVTTPEQFDQQLIPYKIYGISHKGV